mmetsp:Transcript_12661/g.24724  ORF Transcript_12661/g.24724 Transcript_12661/m.24724 type:complete len:241 (-) Transcript_12661:79-801(-)
MNETRSKPPETSTDGKRPEQKLTVKRLAPDDPSAMKQAASVMAKAFVRSPVYRYIWGDDDDDAGRENFLRFVFERNILLRPQCCRCVTVDSEDSKDPGQLVCSFMFIDPEVAPPSLWEMMSVGLLTIPFRFGLSPMLRLLECANWYGQAKNAVLGVERKALQLERMTVLPAFQGQGIGSRSLKVVLEEEAKARKLPVFLATQEERNVRFYGKLGFKVAKEQAFPSSSEFRNWFMLWEPPS